MSDDLMYVILLLFILLLIAAWFANQIKGDPYERAEDDRPPELAGAEVVLPRQRIAMQAPFALHGEPDLVYRTRQGTLVCREDKTGFPHAFADQIQASVYGAILRHNPPPELRGMPVEPYGFIRYGTPGRTRLRWKKVRLFNDEELRRLVVRYNDLHRGAAPRLTQDAGMCRNACGHQGVRCPGI